MMNWRLFHPVRDLMPIYARQAQLLGQAAQLLGSMLETQDPAAWKNLYKEIRNLEHQGDAILGEFRSQIAHCILGAGPRRELTTIAMSMDDALDVVKDSANALLIYKPAKIDAQKEAIASFLPKQLSEEEIREIIASLPDKSIPLVMKHFSANYKGQCDMGLVSKVARSLQ